jgi:hypothetical protein
VANEVEIHVTAKDDTGRVFTSVKEKAKKAGTESAEEFSGSFSGTLPKRQVTAIEKAAKEAEAKAKQEYEKAGESAGKAMGEGVEKGSKDVDKATEKVAARTQQKFEALKFTVFSVGLPAAAAAGVAGVAAATSAVPALFIAGAAIALRSNSMVAESYMDLKNKVVDGSKDMSTALAGPVANGAAQLGESFDRLKPQIASAMFNSSDAVEQLVGTVTDFAEDAMPGFNTAIKTSEAPLKGFRAFVADTGAGVTDLFDNMAHGSASAGDNMETLGGVMRDLEGFTGSLFANLSNGASGVLPQFAGGLHQVEDTVLTLTSDGMPTLQGATSGLLGTIGGSIGIINTFASGLGSWSAPLGSAAGTLYGTNSILKLFGTSLSDTGFGIGAFAKTVQDGDQKISPFKKSLQDAEKNGTSKLKAGANALVSNGLNPLGLALTAGSFILSAFGEAQQKAAEYAAEHRENVRQLTDAIRADNGALGEHVQAVNVDALQQKNATANLSVFSGTLGEAKLAIQGNTVAYQALLNKGTEGLRQTMDSTGATNDQIDAYSGLAKQALETGQSYDQLTKGVGASVFAFDAEGVATDLATDAQKQHGAAIINGLGAVGEQINAQRQAHDLYVQSEAALNNLTAAQVENRDATTKATQAIYAQQNAQLGLRGAQLNTKAAVDEYNNTMKNGKATDDQKAASILKLEQAFAAQEQAAYQAAFADNSAKSSGEQVAAANAAANAETVRLANTFAGQLPASVQQTIGKFSVAQATAAGLTVTIDGTGNAVYRLPNGKFIAITSSAGQEAGRVEALREQINALHNRDISITVTTFYGTEGRGSSLTGPRVARAKGGMVGYAHGGQVHSVPRFDSGGLALDVGPGGLLSGSGDGTSDSIFARVSNGEFVVKAAQTRKHLGLLRAINDGRDGFAGGGMVKYGQVSQSQWDALYASGWRGNPNDGMEALYSPSTAIGTPLRRSAAGGARNLRTGGYGSGAPVTIHIDISGGDRTLMDWLRSRIRVEGGGNVQAALGRG